SDSGAEHGYRDEFKPDGTYHYTGEGQRGDMSFVRANRALRDHQANGKRVHLFEALGDGSVRYLGEFIYLSHHLEERHDTDGRLRQAIVFELEVKPDCQKSDLAVNEPDKKYSTRELSRKSLSELRHLAMRGATKSASFSER